MPKKVPFKVVHASGADDGHSAKELEIHSPTTKGWQTSRFCIYPQEIVLMLRDPMRIRKLQVLAHQFLIPTKIEVFIGNVPDMQAPSLLTCKFRRLGYVSLVDNQNTNFKARELKSVHLDAHGQFVKLLVHKNHVNKYNLFNQVNIIAANVIADDIESFPEIDNRNTSVNKLVDQYMKQDNFMSDPLWGKINKPDFISPLDDLSFDMYQDPETASLIRKLEEKKKQAIKEEMFDDAKRYKEIMTDLYKVGERLGRLNVEKNKAIELEDFDLAKEKKHQIDEYRQYVYRHLNLAEILDHPFIEAPTLDSNLPTSHYSQSPPLPPITRHSPSETRSPEVPIEKSPTQLSPRPPEESTETYKSPRVSPIQRDQTADERPLPTVAKKDENGNADQIAGTDVPRELNEKDAREASLAIEIFGEHVVRCIYTKQWTCRQEGMDKIRKELTTEEPELIKDKDSRSVIRAVVDILKKGFKEQVHPVFVLCLALLKDLLATYIPKQKCQAEISFVIEKTLPLLLLKTGEMAPRMKNSAVEFIIEISQYDDVKSLGLIPELVTRPFKTKQQTPARLYKGRIELIEKLVVLLGHEHTSPNGFSTPSTMKFLLPALDHANGDIRDAAVKVIFELYKLKAPVKDHLPADEPATRKNPLYRTIFDGFDKIDGKPTEAEKKAKAKSDRDNAEKAKQQEIAALQAQLQALREMAEQENGDVKPANEDHSADVPEPSDVDRKCIFCGEKNESFTEEMLDIHYWKACPMLKRCSKCSQVIEICRTNQHLLEECEAKNKFTSCTRCKEAVLKAELDNHLHDKICPKKSSTRCPLCHKAVSSSEEAWRLHLTKHCQTNTKRLEQLKGQGNKAPAFASMTSLRAKGAKNAASTKPQKNPAKTVPRKEKPR